MSENSDRAEKLIKLATVFLPMTLIAGVMILITYFTTE